MKRLFKIILSLFAIWLVIWLISLNAGPKAQHVDYGVTFSQPYASSLGLDWKKTYSAMFPDLNLKRVRLMAYWDIAEPSAHAYNFDDLDFQINEASKNNAQIILSVGRRLPRWPECHQPGWTTKLSQSAQDNELLSYIETVVNRYQNNPNIIMWQVENEAFLSTFGVCPKLDTLLLDKEIATVKMLDPIHPILITDSGELSFWIFSGARGDVFGSTLYRYVYSDPFKRYWTNHIPPIFYRFKAGLLRLVHPGKQVAIIELEAEPWSKKGILQTPIDEQFKTMSVGNFDTITKVAKDTGLNPQYLWGVEWWYWMKQNGHPEYIEKAKELFNN